VAVKGAAVAFKHNVRLDATGAVGGAVIVAVIVARELSQPFAFT
jgi:hypothetical protein